MPSMKSLTFNIMSSLIFGMEQEATRDELAELLQKMIDEYYQYHSISHLHALAVASKQAQELGLRSWISCMKRGRH